MSVAPPYRARFQLLSPQHQLVTPWCTTVVLSLGVALEPGHDSSHFCKPTDVAIVASDGTFFVSDGYCNARIIHFSADGKHQLNVWGTHGSSPGQFMLPHGLAWDEANEVLYVADRMNHRVQVSVAYPKGSSEHNSFLSRARALSLLTYYLHVCLTMPRLIWSPAAPLITRASPRGACSSNSTAVSSEPCTLTSSCCPSHDRMIALSARSLNNCAAALLNLSRRGKARLGRNFWSGPAPILIRRGGAATVCLHSRPRNGTGS